jgi:hypothetical protein
VLGISPDENWWNVVNPQSGGDDCWLPLETTTVTGDISTLPLAEVPPPPTGVAPASLAVQITNIAVNDQNQYVAEFETEGFSPQLPGTHLHFFFDTESPDQVGISGSGQRLMYGGGSPFTGYGPADKPADATQLCALIANPDHSVVPESSHCSVLPDA